MASCSFLGPRGGQCRRPAATESLYCLAHIIEEDEEASQANEFIDTLLENPNVKRGVSKINALLDKFSVIVDQAAKGELPIFKAKKAPPPAPKGSPLLAARAHLHFSADEPLTVEIIKARRKVLARLAHPDVTANGSNEAMAKINKATEILLASLSSQTTK